MLNFSFSLLTRMPRLPIWFLGSSLFLWKLDELKYSQSSTNKMKLHVQVWFSLPSPSLLLKVPNVIVRPVVLTAYEHFNHTIADIGLHVIA